VIPSPRRSSSFLSSIPERAEEQDWRYEFVSEAGRVPP